MIDLFQPLLFCSLFFKLMIENDTANESKRSKVPCMDDMQQIMDGLGFHFQFRILTNNDFSDKVLDPILSVSGGVSDTNELFIRSYHMIKMFERKG